jgi:hypothetical protein
MATYYYNLAAGSNGTGTAASPYNVWPGTAVSAGDSHLFKRGTTGAAAFAISSGANGSITRYGAWFNADGSDDVAQARPIISTSVAMSTFANKRGHLRVENLDIRAPAITVANDAYLMYLSNSATVVNCNLNTNIGCIGMFGCSNVTIQSCTATGVTHSSANNNQLIAVSGAVDQSGIVLDSNMLLHGGGGGLTSHNVNMECTDSTKGILTPVIYNNTFSTVSSASCSNRAAMALRLVRCPDAQVTYCTAQFHQVGLFAVGGGAATSILVSNSGFIKNYHFGISLSTDMVGGTIQFCYCNNNGTATNDGVSLFAYGRGIELTSGAGQSKCASHIVKFCLCDSNYNYGGPSDNGSEGVGIGLDDGTVNCLVYGNTLTNNEGNGIQFYGGGVSATWTDTHNTVFANFFQNNCTASYYNRRSGGINRSVFCADINLAYTYGGPTVIANNLFVGPGTSCGVAMGNSNGGSITVANNVLLGYPNCFMEGRTVALSSDYRNNIMYQNSNFWFVTDAVDGNNTPTYPINLSLQTITLSNQLTSNPMISAGSSPAYMPQPGSPAILAGVVVPIVSTDFNGNTFRSPPTIGMLEYVGPLPMSGGKLRLRALGRR